MTSINQAQKNKNTKALQKVYKALGDGISWKRNITITDKMGLVDSFDAKMVLGISKSNSYIEINCNKKDLVRYKSLGLDGLYYVDKAVMKYVDESDFVSQAIWLEIKPLDVDLTIHIKVK